MAVKGGWAPPGQASDPKSWRYDLKSKGWLEPGNMGSLMGTQLHMPPDFNPKNRTAGWQMVISPPGVQAPVGGVNYTPSTKEVHAPGIPAPVDQLNLSALPAGQDPAPSSPPPATGAGMGGPYMQGTYTDDLARQLAEALGGWSASSPDMQSVGTGQDPRDRTPRAPGQYGPPDSTVDDLVYRGGPTTYSDGVDRGEPVGRQYLGSPDADGYGGSPTSNISPANADTQGPPTPQQAPQSPTGNQWFGDNPPPDRSNTTHMYNYPTADFAGNVAGAVGGVLGAAGEAGDANNRALAGLQQMGIPATQANITWYNTQGPGKPAPAQGSGSPASPAASPRSAPETSFTAPAPRYSQYDDVFRRYTPADLQNDPQFSLLVNTIASAESGHGAHPMGDNGNSHGLFHMNRAGGAGTGYSVEQLNDPDFASRIMVPQYADEYRKQKAAGLTGSDLIATVAGNVQRPQGFNPNTGQIERGSLGWNNYVNSYNGLVNGQPTAGNWDSNSTRPPGINASGGTADQIGPPTPPTTHFNVMPIMGPDNKPHGWGFADPNNPNQLATNADTGQPFTLPLNPNEYEFTQGVDGRVVAVNRQNPEEKVDLGASDQYTLGMARIKLDQEQNQISWANSRTNQQNANTNYLNAQTNSRQVDQPNYTPAHLDNGQTVLVNSKTGQQIKLDDPRDKYIGIDTQSGLAILQRPDGTLYTMQLPGVTGARAPQPVFGPRGQQLTYNQQDNKWDQTSSGDPQYTTMGRYLMQIPPDGGQPTLAYTAPQGSTINVDPTTGAISQINQDTGEVKELKAGRPERRDVNGNLLEIDDKGNARSLYQDPSKNRITLQDGTIVEYDPQTKQYVKKYTPDIQPLNLGKGKWILPDSMRNSVPKSWQVQGGGERFGGAEGTQQPGNGWDVTKAQPDHTAFSVPGQGQDVGAGADSYEGQLLDDPQHGYQQSVTRPGGSSLSYMPEPTSPFFQGNVPWDQRTTPETPGLLNQAQNDAPSQVLFDGHNHYFAPVEDGSKYNPPTDMIPADREPSVFDDTGYSRPAFPPEDLRRNATSPLREYNDGIGRVGGGAEAPMPSAPMGGPAMQPPGGWSPPVPAESVVGTGNKFGQQVDMEGIHKGLDLQAVQGTPALAPADGTVVAVQNKPDGLGQQVLIKDASGQVHALSHMETIDVKEGDQVRAGQPVGTVGSTGAGSTGPHMDYRVQGPEGEYRDPSQLAGPLAQMPTVTEAPNPFVGAGEDGSDGEGGGDSDGYGGGPSVVNAPGSSGYWGGLGAYGSYFNQGGSPSPASTGQQTNPFYPYHSQLEMDLYGQNQHPELGSGITANTPGAYSGPYTGAGPTSPSIATPNPWPTNSAPPGSGNFTVNVPGTDNSSTAMGQQGGYNPGPAGTQGNSGAMGAQAQQFDLQKQQIDLQKQQIDLQYQLALQQLQQQYAFHQDDNAYRQQALQLEDQWRAADRALTAQQNELNRQMQLLVQGSEAQREKFAIQQSALKNPWLQQLSGMAPGWKQAGGPGAPQNPTNGITDPQGWIPNVGITGQGQDVGTGEDNPFIGPPDPRDMPYSQTLLPTYNPRETRSAGGDIYYAPLEPFDQSRPGNYQMGYAALPYYPPGSGQLSGPLPATRDLYDYPIWEDSPELPPQYQSTRVGPQGQVQVPGNWMGNATAMTPRDMVTTPRDNQTDLDGNPITVNYTATPRGSSLSVGGNSLPARGQTLSVGGGQSVGMGEDNPFGSGNTGSPSNTGAAPVNVAPNGGWGSPNNPYAGVNPWVTGGSHSSGPTMNLNTVSPGSAGASPWAPGTIINGSTVGPGSSGGSSGGAYNPYPNMFGGGGSMDPYQSAMQVHQSMFGTPAPSSSAGPVDSATYQDPAYMMNLIHQSMITGALIPIEAKPYVQQYYAQNHMDPAGADALKYTTPASTDPAAGASTVPALPSLPDWQSYMQMTPFERAALRTKVEMTGTAWEDYINQMRTKWGNEGGPTQAPTMTALAAANQTSRDLMGNSQIAETFGNTADEYWQQQQKGWSPASASSVSLVA